MNIIYPSFIEFNPIIRNGNMGLPISENFNSLFISFFHLYLINYIFVK